MRMAENKTYIYRMTHYRNLGFILQNGLHCCNCEVKDPEFISIGHQSLIKNRGQSAVTINPGGVLNDYIPFYFHYKMPMLYHLYKGMVKDYKGTQEDVIYLVSTVEEIRKLNLPFVFTDRHAYLHHKRIFNRADDLPQLSWNIIKDNTWHQQYSDQKKELKQAEFLIYNHVPVHALLGIIVHNEKITSFVKDQLAETGLNLHIVERPAFYYP